MNDMPMILKHFGFHAAAHALVHWSTDKNLRNAWDLYEKSHGNEFMDLQGRPFQAPKMIQKKPVYVG